jgi:hypothetical protein
MIQELAVGQLYSNEEIFKSLGLSNAGGIRTCSRNGTVTRAAVMTSLQGLHGAGENPYHDRLENGVLIYTAAGKVGEQTLSGVNKRLIEQRTLHFPIHGFVLTASRRDKSVGPQRWKYLGLLQYLRHYPDNQIGSDGNIRKVWLFELRIHPEPQHFPPAMDTAVWDDVRRSPNGLLSDDADDDEIVGGQDLDSVLNVGQVEHIRSRICLNIPVSVTYALPGTAPMAAWTLMHVPSAESGSLRTRLCRSRQNAGSIPWDAVKSLNFVAACSRSRGEPW